VDEGRHDRRRHDEERGPVALDEREEPLEVEAGHGHHRSTRRQRQGEVDHEAHDVEEGNYSQRRVAPAHAQHPAQLARRRDEVGVGEHDPLW
jgi:hypothetical protein